MLVCSSLLPVLAPVPLGMVRLTWGSTDQLAHVLLGAGAIGIFKELLEHPRSLEKLDFPD